jgi:tRNA dimethylallyltransferase
MKCLVSIVGTTGVGKNAVASAIVNRLTQKYAIVNCDSMQVYKGLDVVTNKPTRAEMAECEHWLYDFVDPKAEYSVSEFTRDAVNLFQSNPDTIPILVGGTNYYLQALLSESSLVTTSEEAGLSQKKLVAHANVNESFKSRLHQVLSKTDPQSFSAKEIQEFFDKGLLHPLLLEIDPVMANKWHPRDYRKIRRSLEVRNWIAEYDIDILYHRYDSI